MRCNKLCAVSIMLCLMFCLSACSKGETPNRLVGLKGSVTQQNLVYHIESVERLKNIQSYDKALFEKHKEQPNEFDEQGNVVQGKTFLAVKMLIDNKGENIANLYVNGIEVYAVDKQLKVDTKSRVEMEYFNRPQKSVKEFYKASIAPSAKETYEFGYFVDNAILNDPNLCLVINPNGNQLDDKNVVFISINK